jgi:hypothetical protein
VKEAAVNPFGSSLVLGGLLMAANGPHAVQEHGGGAPASAAAPSSPATFTRRSQLRIYTINRGSLDAFVDAWKRGVYPLRKQFGFNVERAWLVRERNQFVWLVTYEGPGDWESAEKAYYASAQRAGLEPDPARFIALPEQWFAEPVVLP